MSDVLHELTSSLKDLAIELGRVPNRSEFQAHVKGGRRLVDLHGGYTAIVQAAGLEVFSGNVKPRRIDTSIFERDPVQHLENYRPKEIPVKKPYPKIATISDIHWPFSCQRVLDAFYSFCEEMQPEYVVLNGDAWDMYSHSKYPRSHNVFTPKKEQELARAENEKFWLEIKKRCPKAVCVQMMGNHDIRPLKRVLEAYPEAEDWITEKIAQLFTFPGVTTIQDPREEYVIGDIAIFHGYRSQLGAHRDYTLMNCINGHTHQGGASFRQIRGQVLWELNSGVAGEPESKGLTYTPQKITRWTPGFGWVDKYGPRFIPA